VFALPGSTYVDQHGEVSSQPDFVFSQAVRSAAAQYLSLVAANLPMSSFWAVRLTSAATARCSTRPAQLLGLQHRRPDRHRAGRGHDRQPYPNWRPGRPGLSPAQIDRWVTWYVGGLANVTSWQMQILSGLGFTGYYQTVTPGSGTARRNWPKTSSRTWPTSRPPPSGAVWDRYYAMLAGQANVMAYISSVADRSGDDDCGQDTDSCVPLTSEEMDSWSATRWITRIARQHGLAVGGENPGYGCRTA